MKLPDFEAWAILAKIIETGSFSRAAAELGLSKATVSKAVTRLEVRLGALLFHRSSRRLTLTETGRVISAQAAHLLAAGAALEEEASEQAITPRGLIRLAAPMSFGIGHLAPILPEFMTQYPEISIDLNLSDQILDLIGDGFDVALRISSLADSSLRARRLCQVRRPLVGSPAYFEKHGRPDHPSQLTAHVGLGYGHSSAPEPWRFQNVLGDEIAVTMSGPLRVNNGDVIRPTLLAGIGLAVQPEFLVWDDLAAGRLEAVMPDWSTPPIAIHLVTPPGLLRPARVEVLIDFLARHFSAPRWAAKSGEVRPK